jgi:RNA polymerase sigma factor (sigma-70 family)
MIFQTIEVDYYQNRQKVIGYILQQKPKYGLDRALELYQEAWLRYLNTTAANPDFEITSLLSTYLIGIVKNLLREEERLKRVETIEDKLLEMFPNEDIILEKQEKEQQILTMETELSSLTERCKEVIGMFYFEGKSHQEIVDVLGYNSLEVSRNTLNRCIDSLRKRMKK